MGNVGDATVVGLLYYVLREYSTRHPTRMEAFADAVAQIPGLAAKVEQFRARGWSGWSSIPLVRAAEIEEAMRVPIAVATR